MFCNAPADRAGSYPFFPAGFWGVAPTAAVITLARCVFKICNRLLHLHYTTRKDKFRNNFARRTTPIPIPRSMRSAEGIVK